MVCTEVWKENERAAYLTDILGFGDLLADDRALVPAQCTARSAMLIHLQNIICSFPQPPDALL